ncbi:MAG: hypothetical protein KatS3mg015_1516 [Fimbriimonadales bacterium]|nr:MAG: hypothetical protein KatS3mg015_1516 [Fimbriimonadales bacterium]
MSRLGFVAVVLGGILVAYWAAGSSGIAGPCDWTQYPGNCDRSDGGCGWGWDPRETWTERRCLQDHAGPPCCLCTTVVWVCQRGSEKVTRYNDSRSSNLYAECSQRRAPGGTPLDFCVAW